MRIQTPTVGLSGRFKLEVFSREGILVKSLPWQKNLILDNGLELFGTSGNALWQSSIMQKLHVGSGNTPPAVTDSGLVTHVAGTTNVVDSVGGIDVPGRFFWFRRTFEFGIGEAAGNLSEIGIGNILDSYFSRALILDGSQSPTTITVLPTEILRASYELRVNQPTGTFDSVVDGYTLSIKTARASDTPGQILSWNQYCAGHTTAFYGGTAIGATIDDGIAGVAAFGANPTADAYVPASYNQTYNAFAGTASANINISALEFTTGGCRWQASVSPAIAKDDLKTLSIDYSLSWTRA